MANQPQNKVKIEVIQGGPKPEAKKFGPIPLERILRGAPGKVTRLAVPLRE